MSRFLAASILVLWSIQIWGQDKIDGLTMVAPPEQFPTNPMPAIKNIAADWVAFVPYGIAQKGNPNIRFGGYWWGETEEGIRESIKLAQEAGLHIMLKPQVWMRGSWIGEMDFDQESDWLIWEEQYRKYIMTYVDYAVKYDLEIFCIGTEYKIAVQKREQFWRELIKDVRAVYDGKIVYSANWDSYQDMPFWDVLDYIGLSAYFPLTDEKEPKIKTLLKKWRPIAKSIKKFSKKNKKKVLFTEYGYLSVDGCANKCWLLEKKVHKLSINEKAQANALEALYTTFWHEEFWAGGFMWKWFPNMRGHEGYPERDYTPQGKLGAEVVFKWYRRS